MPPDTTGHATVSGYTAADFEAPGAFSVTVSDSNGAEEVEVGDRGDRGRRRARDHRQRLDGLLQHRRTADRGRGHRRRRCPGDRRRASRLPARRSKRRCRSGCGTTAGSCKATIVGTDSYGFTTAPVEVTVEVSAATVSVAHATTFFGASASEPSQADARQRPRRDRQRQHERRPGRGRHLERALERGRDLPRDGRRQRRARRRADGAGVDRNRAAAGRDGADDDDLPAGQQRATRSRKPRCSPTRARN